MNITWGSPGEASLRLQTSSWLPLSLMMMV